MIAAPAPNPGELPVGLAFAAAIIVAILLALAGCSSPREILVELPAPPPSVVHHTDTLLVAVPDTLYRVLPGPGRTDTIYSVITVPTVVTEYVRPRPDSSRATRLHGLSLTPDALTLHGTRRDWRFRAPVAGERLVVESVAPDSLTARIKGRPVPPPPQRVEYPACPGPTLRERLRPWLYAFVALLVGCCVGFVLRSFLR